ncbi:hypothetical protein B0O99DRAFT_698992 [Bisporella sp. PMI_857]|nr:hypothetical protein B0O99DRAFT_698992 [Bisporella sp. PMI_857]
MRLILIILPLTWLFHANADVEEFQQARVIPTIIDLIPIIGDVVSEISDLVNEEEKECQFLERTVAQAILSYPEMNVIVYHDSDSTANLVDKTCYHYELDLSFFRTKGYEVCAFRTGSFVLAGDGGCRNWRFGGCYRRTSSSTVSFCTRTAATAAKPTQTAAESTFNIPEPEEPVVTPEPTIVFTTKTQPAITSWITASLTTTEREVQSITVTAKPTSTIIAPPNTDFEVPTSELEFFTTTLDESSHVTDTQDDSFSSTIDKFTTKATQIRSDTSQPTTRVVRAEAPKVTQPAIAAGVVGVAVAIYFFNT